MTSQEAAAKAQLSIRAWNEGRIDLLDEVYAPQYRNNFTGETLDMLKKSIRDTRAAFPDLTITIDDVITEGDKAVVRWTARGVHTGDYHGIPATNRQIEITGVNIGRYEQGKIVEDWSRGDDAGLLRQLGVLP